MLLNNDSNKQQPEAHPDWEEKHPPTSKSPTSTTSTTITKASPTTSRTRSRTSVSFSVPSPTSSSATSSASSSRTARHRIRRRTAAQRNSPSSSPIFTPAELELQKLKRSSWIQSNETMLHLQRDQARRDKEKQGNRWLVVVLVLWIVVIVMIVGCVGKSMLEGQQRQQQLRVRTATSGGWRSAAGQSERSERITSMLERDW